MKTSDLINNLVSKTKPIKPLKKPSYWLFQLVVFSIFYYFVMQIFMGLRSDIVEKLLQPFFAAEIFLILLLILSCLVSSALMIYPDVYQKPYLLKAPSVILIILFSLFVGEFFFEDPSKLIALSTHKIECTICIAAFAIAPSLYFFFVLQKGTNANPTRSGIFAVIAATTLSALALRLSEQQDILAHLLLWHYLPLIFFSMIGAVAGRLVFKW